MSRMIISQITHLSATLYESGTTTPIVGRTISFTIGSQSVSAVTDNTGTAAAELKLTQPAAVTSVQTVFVSDALYLGASVNPTYTITKEFVQLTYIGNPFFSFNSTGAATIQFYASAVDHPDGDAVRGLITNAGVDFIVEPTAFANCTGRPVTLVSPTVPTEGIAASVSIPLTQTTSMTNAGGAVYDVTPKACGGYYDGKGETVEITVAVPGADFVTGGGHMSRAVPTALRRNQRGEDELRVRDEEEQQRQEPPGTDEHHVPPHGQRRDAHLSDQEQRHQQHGGQEHKTQSPRLSTLGAGRNAAISTKANLRM